MGVGTAWVLRPRPRQHTRGERCTCCVRCGTLRFHCSLGRGRPLADSPHPHPVSSRSQGSQGATLNLCAWLLALQLQPLEQDISLCPAGDDVPGVKRKSKTL